MQVWRIARLRKLPYQKISTISVLGSGKIIGSVLMSSSQISSSISPSLAIKRSPGALDGSKSKENVNNGNRNTGRQAKKRKFKEKKVEPFSNEDVLRAEIKTLLKFRDIDETETLLDFKDMYNKDREPLNFNKVEIVQLTHNGDGIAIVPHPLFNSSDGYPGDGKSTSDDLIRYPKYAVILIPFTLPGDIIDLKVTFINRRYLQATVTEFIEKSSLRHDELVQCQYFGKCSGCQYQMMSYKDQLLQKKKVIENAYSLFSNLDPALIPPIQETQPSPLQYGYRTKLTPHFDVPKKYTNDQPPNIGFGIKGTRTVMDIEECPIGTPILNDGLKKQREAVRANYKSYKRGATILLRENIVTDDDSGGDVKDPNNRKTICVSDHKEMINEFVGKYQFRYPAGEFFQNNNSILPVFTSYVKDAILKPHGIRPKYLVDTYCGSGLFSITCSEGFESVTGVEISAKSLECAKANAELNGLENTTTFVAGDAHIIFNSVKSPPRESAVIIDPPRKGSDHPFLDQLLTFKPQKIVYVSCNVHTQARDIGYFLSQPQGNDYVIQSIRGFDLFPQTSHVESIAVLSLK